MNNINFFNISRGDLSKTLILDSESLNSNRIIRKILKYHKWITICAIVGSIIYILFKKSKFIKKF